MKKTKLLSCGIVMILLFTVSFAKATGITWSGATSTDWNVTTNWSTSTVPTSSDDITIPTGLSNYPIVGSANGTCGSITAMGTGSSLGTTGGGILTISTAATTTITGTVTISCPLTINAATNFTTTLLADGLTISGIISGTGAITKAGAGILTLSGVNTYTGATIISAGTLKLGNAAALGATSAGTSITSGAVLDLNGTTYSSAEPLTINGTGILGAGAMINSTTTAATYAGLLTLGSASSIVSGATTGTINISNTGTITGAGFGLTLSGTSTSASVLASILGTTTGTLTKAGTGMWTLSGENTFTGGTTLNAGTLNIDNLYALGATTGVFTINGGTINNTTGGSIQTVSYPIAWNGDFTFTGTNNLNLGSGAVSMNNSHTVTVSGSILTMGSISAATRNLTKAGAGTLSFGNQKVTLSGLTISAGTLASTSDTLRLAGNLSNSGTFTSAGTVVFNGTIAQALGGGTNTFANLTNSNISAAVSISSSITVTGALRMNGANTVLTPAAAVVITGTGATISGNGTIRVTVIGAYATQYAFTTNTLTSMTVDYAGAGAQTISSTIGNYGALKTSSSGTKTLAGIINVNGAITIGSGTTLAVSTFAIRIGGNWINNGIYTAGTTADTVTFKGTSAQQITGSSVTTFSNVTINNAAGVTLNAYYGTVVGGVLTLTRGIVTSTPTNFFWVTTTATGAVTGSSLISYINGPLQWSLATATNYLFPVGDASNYRPFELNSTSCATPVVRVTMSGTGASTVDATLTSVAPRNWYTELISGSFTSATIRITENSLLSSNVVASSSTQSGNYTNIGGNSIGSPVGTITSNATISCAAPIYFAIGTIPLITLSSNLPQVVAANVGVGTTNVVLHKSALAVTTANTTLIGMTCTTVGTYYDVPTDITNLKVWYQPTSTFNAGTATLLSTIAPAAAGTQIFSSFTSQVINSGTTGYIFITADVAAGATVGKTINVSALATTDFIITAGTITGTTAAGGVQTLAGNIILSDNLPQVTAASVGAGTTNLVLHKSALAVNVSAATLTGMTCTTAGSYVSADITNLKVWYQTTSTFTGSGTLLSTFTTPGAPGAKTFPSFTSQLIGIGTTGYIFITADVAAGAGAGGTINLSALTTSNFTFTGSPVISGSTAAGGAQTFSTVFYNKPGGAAALENIANWGTGPLGESTTPYAAPPSFIASNQVFNIYNGATASISGAWAATGAKIIVGNGTSTCNFTIPAAYALSTAALVGVSNNSTLTILNVTVPTLGATGATLNSGSTVVYGCTGATSVTVSNATYGNLTVIGGTGTTFVLGATGASATVAGNFSLSEGTLDMNTGATGATGTLNVAGNFSHTGGTITETGVGAVGVIVFNGPTGTTQTYTSGGTVAAKPINYIINSGATVDFGTSVLSGSTGTFTLSSGGTMGIGSINGITSTGAIGNIQVTGTRTYSSGTSYIYNRTGNQSTGTGLPATFKNLTVSGASSLVMSNAAITCDTLTINSGASFTVDPLLYLTSSLNFTNNGTFTVGSDGTGTGSFISLGTIAGTGTFNVNKYLTGAGGATPSGRFWYVGSPVTATTSLVFDAAGNNKLWSHSEATGLYTEITNNTTSLNVMKGYAARLGANSTITFAGSLNTGTIGSLDNLTRNASSTFEGYNLVCNPYPSAVLFDVTGTGLTRTNLETTIWYRSNSLFPTYNFFTGTTANGGQANIPAMQAFWVKVAPGNTSGTLIMGNTARVHNAQAFYKEASESNVFRMEVSNGTLNDETVVGFYQGAADIFENNDSRKMFSDDNYYPQIYTLTSDNTNVIINGLPELAANEERIVPLGFLTNVSGSFTLNATNMGEFDSNIPVYLEDVQQNVIQDLHQSDTYAFTSSVVNDANRFKLHFGNMVASIPTISESSASIYAANNNIYVNTPKTATIEVYDVLGKLIMNQQSAQGLNKLQLDVETGIYIVKVQTGTQITTKKVMISK